MIEEAELYSRSNSPQDFYIGGFFLFPVLLNCFSILCASNSVLTEVLLFGANSTEWFRAPSFIFLTILHFTGVISKKVELQARYTISIISSDFHKGHFQLCAWKFKYATSVPQATI